MCEAADPARVPPRWVALIAIVFIVLAAIGYYIWRSSIDDEPAAAGPCRFRKPRLQQPQPQAAGPLQPQAVAGSRSR